MLEAKDRKILCITNDFGPRAGGIETFLIGLIERLPGSSVIVYCSQQGDTQAYDQAWLKDFGVEVIRDLKNTPALTTSRQESAKALARAPN